MARLISRRFAAALAIGFGLSAAANAVNFSALSMKCAQGHGDSCSKLENELERCKKPSECLAALSPLPERVLNDISSDQSIDQAIRGKAADILDNRKHEREAQAQRRANFEKLKVGMTVTEVETTIGPIDSRLRQIASNSASPEAQSAAQAGGTEMHFVFTDTGWKQSLGSGNPTNSTYSFEGREYRLVFDYEGKLKEFQYSDAH